MNADVARELSPGVRDLVLWLNDQGFDTCDSGDGSNHAAGMDCAVPFPMVAMTVDPDKLQVEADRLMKLLADRGVSFAPSDAAEEFPAIQGNYNPQDGQAVLVLYNVLSKDVPGLVS